MAEATAALKELSITRDADSPETAVDPALFRLVSVNTLTLKVGGLAGPFPEALGRLTGMKTLILNGNGIGALPESIGKLSGLKVTITNQFSSIQLL